MMKRFLCFSLCFAALQTLALLPQPQVTYYGQAVDEYGWPIQSEATVVLRVDGVELARHVIEGSAAPGINFVLPVLIDNGAFNQPYVGNTAEAGEAVEIVLLRNGEEQPLYGVGAIPPIPAAGTLVYVGLNTGTDSDNDGLSDFWEWDLIWNSGGQLQTLADVTPGGDFDGDGSSEGEEFLAGTIPYWDFDVLKLVSLAASENGDGTDLGFMSVPGKAYQITGTTNNTLTGWQPVAVRPEVAAALQTLPVLGEGGVQVLSVSTNQPRLNFRVETR